jgi:hypothetical protein
MSQQRSRRDFVKKAVYVAPAIVTLSVTPSYAGTGSYGCERGEGGRPGGRGPHGRGDRGPGGPAGVIRPDRGPGLVRRVMNGDI